MFLDQGDGKRRSQTIYTVWQQNRTSIWLRDGLRRFVAAAVLSLGALAAHPQSPLHPSPLPVTVGPDATRTTADPADMLAGDRRMRRWQGVTVVRLEFTGVSQDRLTPLPTTLDVQVGKALEPTELDASLRRLYATGLYDSLVVYGHREGRGVVLEFRGKPRPFLGTISVIGARGANSNSLLLRASRLTPGTPFSDQTLQRGEAFMQQQLVRLGYPQAKIHHVITPQPQDQLVNLAFTIDPGSQARTGNIALTGDSGMNREDFERYAHLRSGQHVTPETSSKAMNGLLKEYRRQSRLEADVKLAEQHYDATRNLVDYKFVANRGPIVEVVVDGAHLGQDKIRSLVPVYEEGAVDEDLLNEGNSRIANYFQRLGYFDVKVRHDRLSAVDQAAHSGKVRIVYHVDLGARRKVERVALEGAHYFDRSTLRDLLNVTPANAFDRHGLYNQQLVQSDVAAIKAIYQNNGFSSVRVTPRITSTKPTNQQGRSRKQPSGLIVTYAIEEGPQQRVRSVEIQGNERITSKELTHLLNTAPGQPLSPENLALDRDAMRTYYLSKGFDQSDVEVTETASKSQPDQTHVVFHVQEGEQVFVRNVLTTGLHFTRPATIEHSVTIHAGDPLNQSALLDTQRNLYDLALFSEVNPVVLNPEGQQPRKTVLLQTVEARRWDISYGAGFEVQTGTVNGSPTSNPNGTVGASPRVLVQVSRSNLFGRDQTASIRGHYGLLEQQVDLLFQSPRFHNNRNLELLISGDYNNSQDVVTYSASTLQANFGITEHFFGEHEWLSKANTLQYQFVFRRVKVNANSVQVPITDIPLLAQAVRVGGPGLTWIRDTRDAPLDAHRGTYTSFQEFLSSAVFSSQANFNQIDTSNSSYYELGRTGIVFARNTRYGQERAYGNPADELIPLPERLYAGGANSHRGFGINAAGPRDPQTGFPIGGAGVFVNSLELRLPPPTLPYFGTSLSFVPFHDMGNVFTNASDVWPSMLRFRQQNRAGCRNLTPITTQNPLSGPVTSTGQLGTCTFNYFSHAVGLGLRYRTPVGPIRVDFSYNLNPPIYPVTYDAINKVELATPYVGEGSHFNFFFSLGQSF